MQIIRCPAQGNEFVTVERLAEWEEVFEELGAKKHDFGFFTVAGWIAEHGKTYEYRLDDYLDERQHDGEDLGRCITMSYEVATERQVPYIAGFATSRSGAWVPHCWNLNADGRGLDLTWHCPQYEVAEHRKYVGRRIKHYNNESNALFEILLGSRQKAESYQNRFEYVLQQVAMGGYIVRDWHGFFTVFPRTSRKLLRESEFRNRITIRECQEMSVAEEGAFFG